MSQCPWGHQAFLFSGEQGVKGHFLGALCLCVFPQGILFPYAPVSTSISIKLSSKFCVFLGLLSTKSPFLVISAMLMGAEYGRSLV